MGEIEGGRILLGHVGERFPKARKIYRLGNHEERWQHWIWNQTPELAGAPEMEFSRWMHFDEFGFECLGDRLPMLIGKLPLFHGHELGEGATSPVSPARTAFLKTYSTIAVNHHHRTTSTTESDMWHSETMAWSIGCACQLNPMYRRNNRWNWGFAIVTVHKNGEFEFENMHINKQGIIRRS